mmetsp:Transcript_13864/g.33544  ORF Transcript_13864/g.33544 Transcript_13864/m.33544 type:complete len:203 (-) Transcript_13864:2343-2951(-)
MGRLEMIEVASKPSIMGICMSINIISYTLSSEASTANLPFSTISISSIPTRISVRFRTFWLILLSSATKTFINAMVFSGCCCCSEAVSFVSLALAAGLLLPLSVFISSSPVRIFSTTGFFSGIAMGALLCCSSGMIDDLPPFVGNEMVPPVIPLPRRGKRPMAERLRRFKDALRLGLVLAVSLRLLKFPLLDPDDRPKALPN